MKSFTHSIILVLSIICYIYIMAMLLILLHLLHAAEFPLYLIMAGYSFVLVLFWGASSQLAGLVLRCDNNILSLCTYIYFAITNFLNGVTCVFLYIHLKEINQKLKLEELMQMLFYAMLIAFLVNAALNMLSFIINLYEMCFNKSKDLRIAYLYTRINYS